MRIQLYYMLLELRCKRTANPDVYQIKLCFFFEQINKILCNLTKGKVCSLLKNIAAQLTEDSNPVLVVVRLKGCPSE